MLGIDLSAKPLAYSSDLKARFWFSVLSVLSTLGLMAWGGFVTSINAGLAVPDWPTSFNSWDALNPFPEWWTVTPILAEHGHRLMGALVGAFTVILALWTHLKESRKWVKNIAWVALALVILQGTLGGLRVVWVSLDLAIVHACFAQLFFATIASLTLFTSKSWISGKFVSHPPVNNFNLQKWIKLTAIALFVQILLGALLRHPGAGINGYLVTLHILGATFCLGLILYIAKKIMKETSVSKMVVKVAKILRILVLIQVSLGLIAYFVLLDESGNLLPSNFQVIVNTSHLILGALLFGTSILLILWANHFPVRSDSNTVSEYTDSLALA